MRQRFGTLAGVFSQVLPSSLVSPVMLWPCVLLLLFFHTCLDLNGLQGFVRVQQNLPSDQVRWDAQPKPNQRTLVLDHSPMSRG